MSAVSSKNCVLAFTRRESAAVKLASQPSKMEFGTRRDPSKWSSSEGTLRFDLLGRAREARTLS
ncbi:hypothetical protein H0H92_001764, partial [Tricholoma furcatifolium]